jgi:predicted AlkP superfamily pyrophosphatase or phosphodiesterase
MAIPKTLQPNVVLRQAGLLTVDSNQISTARVHVYPEGGIGMVYFTVPESAEADRKKTIELFREREEIAQILTPQDFPKYGLPRPTEYPAMADLILVAKDGYGFGAAATGDEFVIKSETTVGTHGFPSTNPKMNATFIASGNGIRRGANIGIVENIDVAPTIAKLLSVPLPNVDGKILTSVLLPLDESK